MKRKHISPSLRFQVLERDGFTCRYCKRKSEGDPLPLEIDHLIPVSKGGSNDIQNLVTACRDCNRGKSAKIIKEATPNPADLSRALHSLRDQMLIAMKTRAEIDARDERKQKTIEYWRKQTGRDSADSKTINVIFRYVETYGEGVVFPWIKIAAEKGFRDDDQIGRYISGIRKKNEELAATQMETKRKIRLRELQKATQGSETQSEYGPDYYTQKNDDSDPQFDESDITNQDTLKPAKYFIDMYLSDLKKIYGVLFDTAKAH
jgi:hypothetical protein